MVRAALALSCLLVASAAASDYDTSEHTGLLQQKNRGQVGVHSVDAPTVSYDQADCKAWGVNFWGLACPSSVFDDLKKKVDDQKAVFEGDLAATQDDISTLMSLITQAEDDAVDYAEQVATTREQIASVTADIKKAEEDRAAAVQEHDAAVVALNEDIKRLIQRMMSAQQKAQEAVDLFNDIDAKPNALLQTNRMSYLERLRLEAARAAAYLACKAEEMWDGLYCHRTLMTKQQEMQQELDDLDEQLEDLQVKLNAADGALASAEDSRDSQKTALDNVKTELGDLETSLDTLVANYKTRAENEQQVIQGYKATVKELQDLGTSFSEKLIAAETALQEKVTVVEEEQP